MKQLFNKFKDFCYKYRYIIIVLFISFLVCLPFLKWYVNADDTYFHINNIIAYGKSNIFSKILSYCHYGFGCGIGIFYPPLPHMLGGIVVHLGFSATVAIRVVKVITIFLSGLFMCFLSKEIYEDKRKGMISAITYITCSYFLVDIFVRDALNESFIFVGMPLVFLGIYRIFYKNDKLSFMFLFSIGYIILIYSHLVLAVFFTMFVILFLIINIKNLFNNKNILCFIFASIIILIFTSTFTVPLIEHLIKNQWHLPPIYKWQFPIKEYFIPSYYRTSSNGLLYIFIPIYVHVLVVFGIYNLVFKKKKNPDSLFLFSILLIGLISMGLTNFKFFWDHCPKFFLNIQITARLVCFVIFSFSIFMVSGIDIVYNFFKKKYQYVLTIFFILLVIYNINFNFKKFKFTRNIKYNNTYYEDYVPKKIYSKSKKLKDIDTKKLIVKEGSADVKTYKIDTTNIKFKVKNIKNKIIIQIPRFYYLGYTIKDEKGKQYSYKMNDIGLIEVELKNNGIYYFKYEGTSGYKITVVIKTIMCVSLGVVCIVYYRKKRKLK